MIVAGAANIMKQLLEGSGVRLAEPIMRLEVMTDQEMVGAVVQDMVQRRGNVLGTAGMSEVKLIILFSVTTHLLKAFTELRGDGRCPPGGVSRVQQGPEDHHQRPGRHQHAAQSLSGQSAVIYFWVRIEWIVSVVSLCRTVQC